MRQCLENWWFMKKIVLPLALLCASTSLAQAADFLAGRNAYITDHYRRFIVPDEIRQKLESLGFSIQFFEEGQGFSIYKDDDPVLLRVMAKKCP